MGVARGVGRVLGLKKSGHTALYSRLLQSFATKEPLLTLSQIGVSYDLGAYNLLISFSTSGLRTEVTTQWLVGKTILHIVPCLSFSLAALCLAY